MRWIAVLLMMLACVGAAWGQSSDALAQRVAALEERVAAAERALDATTDPDAVSEVRLDLQEARGSLGDLRSDLNARRAEVGADIALLGPAPEDGDEPRSVAELRSSYAARLDDIEQLSVVSAALDQRIARLQQTSAEQLRTAFFSRTLARTPLPYLPAQIEAATGQAVDAVARGRDYVASVPQRTHAFGGPVAAGAALAVSLLVLWGLTIPIRDRIAARLWRRTPAESLTPAARAATALTRASTRIVLAGLGLFIVHRVAVETGLVGDDNRAAATALARAAFVFAMANAVSLAVFSPGKPHWCMVDLQDRTAASAHGSALSVAVLFTLDQALLALLGQGKALTALVRLETLAAALVFGAVLIATHRRLGRRAPPPAKAATPEGSAEAPSTKLDLFSRTLLLLPALVMIMASVLGYAALSRWVFERVAFFAIFIGFAYLLSVFFRSWLLVAMERLVFGHVRQETPDDDIIGFWTRLTVDGLLIIAAIPVGLAVLGVKWAEIRAAVLRILEGFTVGAFTIAPASIVTGLLLVAAILVGTRLTQRVLDNRILPMTRMNPGVRHSFRTLVGYAGLLIAFFTGVSALGFNLSNLAIIAGALSVGIGFGLQSIVNNFVSGLILLIERPIKIGDWVITASGEGTVKKINVRSTEIETFDRCSVIVPNSELITSAVQNWTYKDQTARVIVAIGVAYDTDLERARSVLLACVRDEPEMLSYPEPYVYLQSFGDSSVNLELRVFIRDANKSLSVRNALRFKVFTALRDAKIEIPFPQRDLHVRSGGLPTAGPGELKPTGDTTV